MPTDLFLKQPIEKQEKILSAAKKEFSRCSYVDASINHIIKDAGISRGSFYDYFVNKEDIFFYIFQKDVKEPLIQRYLEKYKGQPVDLFELGLYSFDIAAELISCKEDFFITIFTTTNMKQLNYFLKIKRSECGKHTCAEHLEGTDIEKIGEFIKLSNLNYANIDELIFICDIVKLTVLSAIISMLTESSSTETTREKLIAHFQALKRGFEK